MKNTLFILLLLLAFTACGDKKAVTDVLNRAETLMDESPDSSLTLLRTLTLDDFRKESTRARYALLHSQALDKNYIDVTSDSLISVAVDYSQTNFYSETKTFLESDYTYKVDVYSWGEIYLYNTSNSWINKSMMYKGTNQIYVMSDVGEDLFDHASWLVARENVQTILSNALSRDEKRMIGDKEMIVTMYVNSTTGRIDDVMFEFFNDSPYRFVPVSTFRAIELSIKQNIQLTLADSGRRLNYIYWWEDVKPGL